LTLGFFVFNYIVAVFVASAAILIDDFIVLSSLKTIRF